MLLATLIFLAALLPTQLGLHFWPEWAYVQGLSIDYLSPTIYLTDLLLIILFLNQLSRIRQKIPAYFWIITPIVFLNILTSLNPVNTLIFWLRISLLTSFAFALTQLPPKKLKTIITILTISTAFISLLALMQFISQSSIDGIFYFFGERHFTLATPGISKFTSQFLNRTFLRSYSTFSHPNSLAGYLSVLIVLLVSVRKKIKINKSLFTLSIILSLLALVTTFSRTAFISLLLITPLFFLNRKYYSKYLLITIIMLTLSTLVPLASITDSSYTDRIIINQSSLKLILNNPLTGVGLNNFISAVSTNTLNYQLLQPAHNVYLLISAELGLLIVGLLTQTIPKPKNANKLFYPILAFILLSGSLDHYWVTLPQNRLLLFLIIGLTLNTKLQNKPS